MVTHVYRILIIISPLAAMLSYATEEVAFR